MVAPGAVDQDIDRSKRRFYPLVRLLDARLVQHVAGEGLGDAARLGDLIGGLAGHIKLEVQHRDLGAALRERVGHHTAQDAAPAGDDGHLVLEINTKRYVHSFFCTKRVAGKSFAPRKPTRQRSQHSIETPSARQHFRRPDAAISPLASRRIIG